MCLASAWAVTQSSYQRALFLYLTVSIDTTRTQVDNSLLAKKKHNCYFDEALRKDMFIKDLWKESQVSGHRNALPVFRHWGGVFFFCAFVADFVLFSFSVI